MKESFSFEDFKEQFGNHSTEEKVSKQTKTQKTYKVNPTSDPPIVTDDPIQDEIYNKLKKMYENPKSNAFVVHLLRSYLPDFKVHKVFTKPKDINNFKCAITGVKLISMSELMDMTSNYETYGEEFFTMLKKNLSGDTTENPIQKMINNRVMGLTGFKTNTYLCQCAIDALYDLYTNKILYGDRQMKWLANDMMKKAQSEYIECSKIFSTITDMFFPLPEDDKTKNS